MFVTRNLNKSHLSRVIDIHLVAFKDHLNVSLGRIYLRTFFKWFIKNGDISLIIEDKDKNICGYIIGSEDGYQKKLNQDIFFKSIISIIFNPIIFLKSKFWITILKRLKMMLTFNEKKSINISSKTISLVGIGVERSFLGSGAAGKLIENFEKISLQKNFNVIRLSVYSSNARALRFYTKNGYAIEDSIAKSSPVLTLTKHFK